MPISLTPARMSILNLDTAEELAVQFNPKELKRRISANYAMKDVLGNSHQEHEYLSTRTQEIDFDLFYIAETNAMYEQCTEAMQFLESLLYAQTGADTIAKGQPPRVLLVWPYTMSIMAKLDEVEFTHQRFNWLGFTTQFTARCRWTEARVSRLTANTVRALGARRGFSNVDAEGVITEDDNAPAAFSADGDVDLILE